MERALVTDGGAEQERLTAEAQRAGDAAMETYLRGRMVWLVRLRWMAIAGIVVAAITTAWLDVLEYPWMLLVGAALLGAGNLVVLRVDRLAGVQPGVHFVEQVVLAQILLDLAVLTLLLQLSGGPENPFSMLYVFHMALAGMLLPLRLALVAGLAAWLFHGIALIGELHGVFPHVPLAIGSHHMLEEMAGGGLWASPMFVTFYLVAFALTQFGVIWFVHHVVERYRDAEERRRRQEVIALSRERLARVGALAAGVAHTIRNPLHGLMNCTDLLQRQTPEHDTGTREILEVMQEGVDRIETITSRLLALTRSRELRLEDTDLRILAEDALRFVGLRARELGIHVQLDVMQDVRAHIDVPTLSEAVASIVDNALYVSQKGSTVRIEVGLLSPGRALIAIEDTGPGISSEDLERVFDPFFTTKPVGEGSGLGLAIARRAIEDHGGQIRVSSTPGLGTRVSIELPAEVGSA